MSEMAPAKGPMGKLNGWLHGLFDSDMFTAKQILKIFYPLLLDQFSIHLIMAVSTALVSSVGQAALAAVSMVNTLSFVVTAVMFALSAGGGVIIAQAKGSGDEERLRKAVGTAAFLATVSMLVISVVLYFTAEPVINLLYGNAEPLLKEYAVHYMKLLMLSMVPYALFHALFTAFRSVGDSKTSLILTLYINISHLALSILFINVLGMGVTGSGLSLIVARVIGVVVALWWVFKPTGSVRLKVRDLMGVDRNVARPIIKLSIPFCVEQLLFQGGMVAVQGYLSNWGTTPEMATLGLAAHAVASSVVNLYNASCSCISQMTGTVCGQCIGAGKIELAKRYKESMVKGGRLVLLLTVLVLFPLTPLILKLYNPNPEAVRMIYMMLMLAVFPMPIIWCNVNVPATMMCSAGDVQYSTYTSLLALLVGRVCVGYVLTIVLNLGPVGIWLAQLLELFIRVVLLEKRYRSGKWMRFITNQKKAEAAG